ncbi:unnamed protein product [Cunninghamella echinulata]
MFHCPPCIPIHGQSTFKPKPRKSKRDSTRLNYADMNEGLSGNEKIWGKLLKSKTFSPDQFQRVTGDQVTFERLKKIGMKEPFVILQNQNLDMNMPSKETTVADIAKAIGEDRSIEVIDVATQADLPGWTLGKWARYYHSPNRDRIRNVISLEISGTEFANNITRPKLVRDMDWIDHMWPTDLRPIEYPKVQLYCLMGTKDSYTDFHIDFGGTSVFYHIISGSKVFYFIEPTSKNLKKYQKWSSSPDQTTIFLGDQVKNCYSVHLKAGNTMIIPTGWIHAVYTPEDALVIGGNFLHGLNIGTQLEIFDIEEATNVPAKFRFPYFKKINWYAAEKYNKILQENPKQLSIYELQGIMDLARWLQKDITLLEDHSLSTQERKAIKLDIPTTIHDPSQLISNLLYGVEKVIKHLGKKKRRSKKITENTTSNDLEQQQTVVKLKLKFESKKTLDETSTRSENNYSGENNHNTEEFTKNEHPLNNNSNNSNPSQPKLFIKLNKPTSSPPTSNEIKMEGQDHSSDEEYHYDENVIENDEDDDEVLMDSDDFEYQEEDYQPLAPPPPPINKQSVNKRKSRKSTTTFRKGNDSDSDSSSSDDDMGTSKRIAGSSLKSHNKNDVNGNTKRARYSSSVTSVKQRLLDRFIKR